MKKGDSVVYLSASHQTTSFSVGSSSMPIPVMELLPQVQMLDRGHPERAELEQYIHDRFAREYGANIHKYMPNLIKYSNGIQTYAAVGFRTAADHQLFLETYLHKAIEHELMDITGLDINRAEIIEVGNLAATKPGSSAALFGALACFLDRIHYEWVVICATPTVQNVFSKLQIPLIRLADASKEALPEDQQTLWGSYYDCKPQVMVVHVRTAHRCVKDSVLGTRLLTSLYPGIELMVDQWVAHDSH